MGLGECAKCWEHICRCGHSWRELRDAKCLPWKRDDFLRLAALLMLVAYEKGGEGEEREPGEKAE